MIPLESKKPSCPWNPFLIWDGQNWLAQGKLFDIFSSLIFQCINKREHEININKVVEEIKCSFWRNIQTLISRDHEHCMLKRVSRQITVHYFQYSEFKCFVWISFLNLVSYFLYDYIIHPLILYKLFPTKQWHRY